MKKQIEQLREFHTAFNLPLRSTPTLVPRKEFALRQSLLSEEVTELLFAHQVDKNLTEVADAIIDSMYVLIGTAVQLGFGDVLEQLFDEVHRSNMSKLDEFGKPVMREDGKVLKSNLFSPPDFSSILKL